MSDVRDPGPENVDKILDDLEDLRRPPTEVARQARRLRAHIAALRARVQHCINIHGDDALYDPALEHDLGGSRVNALEAAATPGSRHFDPNGGRKA